MSANSRPVEVAKKNALESGSHAGSPKIASSSCGETWSGSPPSVGTRYRSLSPVFSVRRETAIQRPSGEKPAASHQPPMEKTIRSSAPSAGRMQTSKSTPFRGFEL